jgi:hypothetical protein
MHLSNSEQSAEQVVLVLGRRAVAVFSGAFAGLIVALGIGIAVLTMMYK